MRLFGAVLCLLATLQATLSQECVETCTTTGEGWNSNVAVVERGQTFLTLEWEMDQPDTVYRVRWFQERVFIGEDNTTDLMYTMTDLTSNTQYTVTICRQIVTDDTCGNCDLCATTLQGPPAPPGGVAIQVNGQEFIRVLWQERMDGVDMWHVLCLVSDTGEVVQNSSIRSVRGTSIVGVNVLQLTPSTTYNCSVAASNSFGQGEYSPVVQGTTLASTRSPGILLMVFDDSVKSLSLTVDSVEISGTYEANEQRPLFSHTATITGIDYHFHRGQIYFTSADLSLYRVNVTLSSDSLSLLNPSAPEVILADRPADSLGSVAVDWIYNEIYWIENSTNESKIMRGDLTNGGLTDSYCVLSTQGLRHIAVDPVRGWLFWSSMSGLYRAPLSSVRAGNSDCPALLDNMETIVAVPVIFFTPESTVIYLILEQSCVTLPPNLPNCLSSVTANGNNLQNFNGAPGDTTLLAIYNNRALLVLNTSPTSAILVVTTGGLNTPITGDSASQSINSGTAITNLTMMRVYRDVLQPLPVPPFPVSDVRVDSVDVSARVSWTVPVFSGSLFSNDSYRAWEYSVQYSQLSSGPITTIITFDPYVNLAGLTGGALYELDIVARGLSDSEDLEVGLLVPIVFHTRTDADLQLVVATESGVITTNVGLNSVSVCVENTDSSGVAFDSHTDTTYWLTEGSRGDVVSRTVGGIITMAPDTVSRAYALRLDWVTRRLFWVQDGIQDGESRVINVASVEVEDASNPVIGSPEVFQTFSGTTGIETTAMDATNGFLFWVSDSTIYRKMLNGEGLTSCHASSSTPTALAIDSGRRRLYWLSNTASSTLTVNQLEYNTAECDTNSIVARDLSMSDFSFGTATATVMVYASDTLFIASGSTIHSIPSQFTSVPSDRSLFVGQQQVTDICLNDPSIAIEDMTVTSRGAQPLPPNLQALERGVARVTPQAAPSPPSEGPGSTITSVVLQWTAPPPVLPNSPLTFILNYLLNGANPVRNVILKDTNVTVMVAEERTQVNSSLVTCSLWVCGPPTAMSTVQSLPAVPGVVTDVRVIVYQPLAGETDLTGLVLWTPPAGSIIDSYSINLALNVGGTPLPLVYQPPGNLPNHVLVMRADIDFAVSYLEEGTAYDVQITASNMPSGPGIPSSTLTFTLDGPNYPRHLLVLDSGNAQVAGMDTDFVTPPTTTATLTHLLADTIAREAYYFDRDMYTILKSSLQSGEIDTLKLIGPDLEMLSLAYDWVARVVYYAVRTTSNQLEFYSIRVLDKDRNALLFPSLDHTLSQTTTLQLTMDPMAGVLYWIQSDGSTIQLLSLNLRQSNLTTPTILSTTSRRRKRQSDTLSSLNLTPVLTLDPITRNLLVATSDGDIHSCNITSRQCTLLVDAATLSGGDTSSVGLPPTSIAADDRHLYWSGGTGVYAVLRTDPTSLITVSMTGAPSTLTPLSPGAQPLGRLECLSPPLHIMAIRPVPKVVDKTSTSLTMEWEEPPLSAECADVFSFPPLNYIISVADPGIDRFFFNNAGMTYGTRFELTGLLSFVEYPLSLITANVFSQRRFSSDDQQGSSVADSSTRTLAGVPDAPTILNSNVIGTSSVELNWAPGVLRGDPNSVVYFVRSETGQSISVMSESTTIDSSIGIPPGSDHQLQVVLYNGAFNSPAARVRVSFWRLPPRPLSQSISSSNLTVNFTLEPSTHSDIASVAVQYCEVSVESTNCSCPDDSIRTEFRAAMTPMTFVFPISGLGAYTLYCVQSVGRYREISGKTVPGGEVTSGQGRADKSSTTMAGLPDRVDVITLSGSLLSWEAPNPRSPSGIINYLVSAREVAGIRNATMRVFDGRSLDLQTQFSSLEGLINYDVSVQAVNDIGTGPPSDSMVFTPQLEQPILGIGAIVGIALGGAALIALCLGFFLFCVWFVRLSRPKEQEIRSLSYMYGPDHELSNLRSAYRHEQAQNPHYTWTNEDYVCTDDDLDKLSKFPRHNLKLENFIDRGEFGEVYQGTATDILGVDTGATPVAVKTLRKGANSEDQKKFLSEASLMSNFNHPNIVKVLGVCLDNDPVYIIMELMPGGDLLKFLREAKRDHGPVLLTLAEQIQIMLDVAHGCRYLEQQHFIHRDIAARNCLVSSKGADRMVKIGDFGLARDLYSSDYYQVEGQRKLPVRWMAPEALLQGKFTVESDTWSFGVLLWEIMSLGNQPYPGRINQEVLQFVTGGGRLEKPEKCPSKIYHLMQNCWKRYSSDRPHFDSIVPLLTNFLDRIKRPDSVYHSDSESEPEEEPNLRRTSSGKPPSRTPSFKSGFMNLARSGSVKLRNSFRRHGSIHKREENNISQLPEDANAFREVGPF
ncbi:proto-oncogene tyrosine-protein kinase ROS-like isoform X2 [Halichondria panicea]|uniref:proto-oncogene tyrosine-protein kinase ROS-like isoform X2 n=1 Tax=Halichondria panicea TaxID=6063 RepID=UPI00312B8A43